MSRPGATLVITRGLPASGKTTWAKAWVAEDPENRARVNRDDLRAMMHPEPPTFDYAREQAVTAAQQNAVRALLKRGVSVVTDDTNLRLKYARAWADLAFELSAEFQVQEFDTDVDECVRRDAIRCDLGERYVGEKVIRDMAARFHGPRQPVTRTEATAPTRPQYVPNHDLPKAYIVDVDGTVALKGDRGIHDYDMVHVDTPHEAVVHTVKALAEDHHIVFLSGREDSCREATLTWLWDHLHMDVAPEDLVMRKTGDHRNDAIVKIEMFEEHVAPRYHVIAAIDDRDRVVAAWRAHGITCLQVAEGDF